jgi:hypothetical protein
MPIFFAGAKLANAVTVSNKYKIVLGCMAYWQVSGVDNIVG